MARDGEFNHRLSELEADMENKVLGEGATTLRARVNELEKDKATRLAVQATIGAIITFAVAIAGTGVVGAVDRMRNELHLAAGGRATLRPIPSPAAPEAPAAVSQ